MKTAVIDSADNVAVALQDIYAGEDTGGGLLAREDIPCGHKLALCDIDAGANVIKYGFPIGTASEYIPCGALVHSHNLKTALTGAAQYDYDPVSSVASAVKNGVDNEAVFYGYPRKDGSAGTRNGVWVIPTVGCANAAVRDIAAQANALYGDMCDGVHAFTHPYGCSQLGEDAKHTSECLAALSRSPNAGGVLFVSLGCENNNIDIMRGFLGDYDTERVRFLVMQECEDEVARGVELCKALCELAGSCKRTAVPLSGLVVGMKCGGSDAFSGITANVLCGMAADKICAANGSVILTEVPEMFGAEQLLFNRCENREIFNDAVNMINSFKGYFEAHGEPVFENPSPGNKRGGITTLEEKSLGCIRKGGYCTVRDVLPLYTARRKTGLSLLWGPGNDIVSSTNLTAAGANLILFTTGRGTPLGAPVPTLKIASNTPLAVRKAHWTDFDAGCVLGGGYEDAAEALTELIIKTACGELTANERSHNEEIAIFKGGITL